MGSRWKMNRMGFVNFWLYDEETFTFEDGKLLLRGQNGSGKSITTQSFIPFILDGDRTPSRLDPFGSSDRKMEYYFLGEEGREEATGYLFLEFEKPDTRQYRTIGIGQRARRGAPMTFWGFVLLDGRRIGYDLNLYKEAGNTRLPHTKQDLKKLLGPEVPFTDSPGEYKAMVNRHIFGFRRMEQYDQFIRLLVKVRAPKLSKEFKPTRVYDILNESLQTLTDEELRAMVDAMEKLDAIQNSLDHLKAAQKDAQNIQKEYTRYNQFMAGRKARAYTESSRQTELLKQRLEESREEQKELDQEETGKRREADQAEQRMHLVDTELDSLKETDLDTVTQRLLENRSRRDRYETEKQDWEEKAQSAREHLLETDRRIREHRGAAEYCRMQIQENRQELEELQEILQSEIHDQAVRLVGQETVSDTGDIAGKLRQWRQKITEGLKTLKEQEELERRYDQAAQESARCLAQTVRREAGLLQLEEAQVQARDNWVRQCFGMPGKNRELVPEQWLLKELEADIAAYQGPKDRTAITKKWEQCAGRARKALEDLRIGKAQEMQQILGEEQEKQGELKELEARKDWEPARAPGRTRSRQALTRAGIHWTPFYQAMEFADGLSDQEKNLLEEQLKDAGILDALVVDRRQWDRVRAEFPEYADLMLCVPEKAQGPLFQKLVPAEGLGEELKQEAGYILQAMSGTGEGLTLGEDGFFRNGILEGRSLGREEASLIGQTARRRRLEQQMAQVREALKMLGERRQLAEAELEAVAGRMAVLEEELAQTPDGEGLDRLLEQQRECRWYLAREQQELDQARVREDQIRVQKDTCFQKVIRIGRELPYARTCAAYEEALGAVQEYLDIWTDVCGQLHTLGHEKALLENEQEKQDQYLESQDLALGQVSAKKKELEILAVAIRKGEEFLDRPENRQLARRLQELRTERQKLEGVLRSARERLAVIASRKEQGQRQLAQRKAELAGETERETRLRQYFEEELALGLVVERGNKTLKECAAEAMASLRESDRNREAGALVDSLYQTCHKYSGSLAGFGTAMEDCFGEGAGDGQSLRKRQRIYPVWNGKKLYFAQFCQALKNSIEETELLIREKDREIFVDILSRTLSQQLTDRIEESRQWIRTMSALMKQMDTSMGLSFSLEWKARTAQNEEEMDTLELEKLLRRDQTLLTPEDVERVALHFRSRIQAEKARLEEDGVMISYIDLVRDALDYRKWFEFQMFYYRNQEGKKPLTNGAFNRFSGGEKAMAMYVPLFAAVNAQYQKSSRTDFPRMIALDEAFAGVDDRNISSMFGLVETLDFDYIMNSQAIWGCYGTVPALRISELYRPADARVVTVIHYTWNGHERILDEQ